MASIKFMLKGYEVTLSTNSEEDLKYVLSSMCVTYWDAYHHNAEHGYPVLASNDREQAKILDELFDNLLNDEEEDDEEDLLDGDLEDVFDEIMNGYSGNMPCDTTGYCDSHCPQFWDCIGGK